MLILSSESSPFSPLQRELLEPALKIVGPEKASYLVTHGLSAKQVHGDIPGWDLYVATDRGLYVCHATQGHNTAEELDSKNHALAIPWGIVGSFVLWGDVRGVTLSLGATWDAEQGKHVRRGVLQASSPAIKVHSPDSARADIDATAAWDDFAEAVITHVGAHWGGK